MTDIVKRNNVSIFGSGSKTMVLAHGYGCDKQVWNDISAAFEKDYSIVTFDYVGAGGSDLTAYNSERYSTLDGYAKDILEIYHALSLKDTIFVGHSVSSMIGLLAANQRPEYFEKLIFLGPSPRYLNDEEYHGGFERSDLEDLFEMMDSNYLGWSKALAPAFMANPDKPELGERLTNNFCATDPIIAREFARTTFLADNRSDLKYLITPSLTLQCTADIVAPMEVGQYMHEQLKDNTMVILEATGHCPHMSAPDETINAIKAYLN
ncbi:alpha/beta fold hydrolase [Pedobacter insulae]|uniref:Pimeloyl-ACP methyl ester carboxylesterase n=1 Tax=Pedobacter insulae TaxID=414048 RepID=A0A1I2WGY3_9SPHI|nr:alpha/beta hydrolase [Pedobacter insulae]SFH00508.1 Pimeloyl-ACP methyl ester carboxylesterase [Pedobacter insulae]